MSNQSKHFPLFYRGPRGRKLRGKSLYKYSLNMFNAWLDNQLIQDRKQIIEEAKRAFELKMYYSVVSLMISELEHLMKKQIKRKNNLPNESKISFAEMKRHVSESEPQLASYINDVYLLNDNGYDVASNLSRHSIHHGNDPKYGTRENAITLIYLYDYLLKHNGGKFSRKDNEEYDDANSMEALFEEYCEKLDGDFEELKFKLN